MVAVQLELVKSFAAAALRITFESSEPLTAVLRALQQLERVDWLTVAMQMAEDASHGVRLPGGAIVSKVTVGGPLAALGMLALCEMG